MTLLCVKFEFFLCLITFMSTKDACAVPWAQEFLIQGNITGNSKGHALHELHFILLFGYDMNTSLL